MNGNLRHIILLPLALLMAMGIASCGDKSQPDDSSIERDEWKAYQAPAPESFKAILGPVSDEVNSLPTYIERRPLKQIFNDSNELQLKGARRWGIAPLSHDLASAWHLKKPIVKIETCRAYVVDSLTMSMPFLVPHAAKLLEEIGLAFSDTVRARGGHEYRIKVTSLTRSDYTVSRLKRRNRATATAPPSTSVGRDLSASTPPMWSRSRTSRTSSPKSFKSGDKKANAMPSLNENKVVFM